jgi:hypothetical protein
MGTSSSRNSSSGACSDSAKVTGMPSPASRSMAGTSPTVDIVSPRADIPRPSGAGSVSRRIAAMAGSSWPGPPHPHEDDVRHPQGTLALGVGVASGDFASTQHPGPATTCSTISAVDRLRVSPP